jgi:two-component system OmpR family response regulator
MGLQGRQHSPEPPPIVLIVDDDRDTRELYETVFKLEGFWVTDAPDAEAAFEQAADLQPDVVITDLGLPGRLDGAQLASRIHALAKTANIPIIAVTGRDASLIAPEGDFIEVLQKPVTPEALIAATRRVLAASLALRQRSQKARARIPALIEKSERLLGKGEQILQRTRHPRK